MIGVVLRRSLRFLTFQFRPFLAFLSFVDLKGQVETDAGVPDLSISSTGSIHIVLEGGHSENRHIK